MNSFYFIGLFPVKPNLACRSSAWYTNSHIVKTRFLKVYITFRIKIHMEKKKIKRKEETFLTSHLASKGRPLKRSINNFLHIRIMNGFSLIEIKKPYRISCLRLKALVLQLMVIILEFFETLCQGYHSLPYSCINI